MPSCAPDTDRKEVKFIADAMLGRLARWLRFLGFDTVYIPGISDGSLIRIAREQERTILTRDTRLVLRKGLGRYLLIASNDPFQQLLETVSTIHPGKFQFLSRCVACNGSLQSIGDKSAARDLIPEYVFLHCDRFQQCADCGKIYWEGTHAKKFRKEVREMLGGD